MDRADLVRLEAAWVKFKNDFDNMSDADIVAETRDAEAKLSEAEEWLEAVAAWEAAGRPRQSLNGGASS